MAKKRIVYLIGVVTTFAVFGGIAVWHGIQSGLLGDWFVRYVLMISTATTAAMVHTAITGKYYDYDDE